MQMFALSAKCYDQAGDAVRKTACNAIHELFTLSQQVRRPAARACHGRDGARAGGAGSNVWRRDAGRRQLLTVRQM
jgi:hypothetical protein